MKISDTLELVSTGYENDDFGVSQPTETVRRIYCRVESISAQEFFQAGQTGLKPAWRFRVHQDEYRGEPTVRYQGRDYAVYRTYRASQDELEIYVEGRAGV